MWPPLGGDFLRSDNVYWQNHSSLENRNMARKSNRDIAWERAAVIRGKNPRAWRRDERGNRIRYGSFETRGRYAWTLERGKAVSLTVE
jgi:hypothetical protein